jgi:hypothetical protein
LLLLGFSCAVCFYIYTVICIKNYKDEDCLISYCGRKLQLVLKIIIITTTTTTTTIIIIIIIAIIIIIIRIIIIIGSTVLGGHWSPQTNVTTYLYSGNLPASFYNPLFSMSLDADLCLLFHVVAEVSVQLHFLED